jgi:hypothetical protein
MLSFSQTLACALALVVPPSFAATQIYTYRDDAGTQIFTTELDSVPEQYRSRVIPLISDQTSHVSRWSLKFISGSRPNCDGNRRVPDGRPRHESRCYSISH